MEKLKKILRIGVFLILILLAMSGMGLPALFFTRHRKMDFMEQVEEREEGEEEFDQIK